jgi:hypothetical protein
VRHTLANDGIAAIVSKDQPYRFALSQFRAASGEAAIAMMDAGKAKLQGPIGVKR